MLLSSCYSLTGLGNATWAGPQVTREVTWAGPQVTREVTWAGPQVTREVTWAGPQVTREVNSSTQSNQTIWIGSWGWREGEGGGVNCSLESSSLDGSSQKSSN